jgi:hypothetical protein
MRLVHLRMRRTAAEEVIRRLDGRKVRERGRTEMKRKLLVLLAAVVVLSVVIAAPALACEPQYGEMELVFNNEKFAPGPGAECPEALSWYGTIEFGEESYGIAYFPAAPPVSAPGGWRIFQEDWTIFTLPEGGVSLDAACDESSVVLEGHDVGLFVPPNLDFAIGSVTAVNDDCLFDDSYLGSTVFWDGIVDDTVTPREFSGTFRIFPSDDDHHGH